MAWELFVQGEYVRAERAFRLQLAEPDLTAPQQQQARYGLGYVLAFSQHYNEARDIFEMLRREAVAQNDPGAEHRALHQVGMVERMAGNWTSARECFERERQLIASSGNEALAVAVNAYELGLVALQLGQNESSKAWFDLSLTSAQRTEDQVAVGCAYRGLGDWHQKADQPGLAVACWTVARDCFLQAADLRAVTDIDSRLLPT